MRIKAKDIKSCLNCQFVDAIIIPDRVRYGFKGIKVECVKDTTKDIPLRIDSCCPHWERKN